MSMFQKTASLLLLLAVVADTGPARIYIAQLGGALEDTRMDDVYRAIARELERSGRCKTIHFAAAVDKLRTGGFEPFEICRGATCATAHAVYLRCDEALFGFISGIQSGYRISLQLVDASGAKKTARIDRNCLGSWRDVIAYGIPDAVRALGYEHGIAGPGAMTVEKIVRDRRSERVRFAIGFTAGALGAAAAVIVIFNAIPGEESDEGDSAPVIIDW